jgi:hypothetical protein
MNGRHRTRAIVWGAFLACAVILIVVGLRTSPTRSAAPVPATTSSTATTTPASTTTAPPSSSTARTTTAPVVPKVDAGRLPQTRREPSFGLPLTAQMQTIWSAIVADSPAAGRPVFFPESAYVKMKTGRIADAVSDYTWRLIAFYDLDLAAYHAHLGAHAATAKLIAVRSNPALAVWIPAGACENSIGYWHLPGTRLVYTEGGRTYSVRVASLISWRGVWYLVHLGPNPRPVNAGTVDDPQIGPGTPGPAGGC